VSLTLAAYFAAGIFDTGAVVHLDLRISPVIFKKILNDPNIIFRSLGDDDSWKKTL